MGCISNWLLTDYFGYLTAKIWPKNFQKLVDKPNPQPDAPTISTVTISVIVEVHGYICNFWGDATVCTVLGMVTVPEIVTGVLMAILQVVFLEMDVKESWPSWDDDDDSLGMVTVLGMVTGYPPWDGDCPRDLTIIEYKLTGTDRRTNLGIGRHAPPKTKCGENLHPFHGTSLRNFAGGPKNRKK